jgi:hypothetical protein
MAGTPARQHGMSRAAGRRTAILGGLCLALLFFTPRVPDAGGGSPGSVDDAAFWRMFSEFSEPNGYFRSDNLVSNERTFQEVIPALQAKVKPDSAYVGVGPEQNFTYLVALRPQIAFIVDIRRQNGLLHLLYKALLEMSADRVEFLSRLFSRPEPSGARSRSTPDALFYSFRKVEPSPELFDQNLRAVIGHLVTHHHFPLTENDKRAIEYIYSAFYEGGPDLSYSMGGRRMGARRFPTYAELMQATDGVGTNHAYLASNENYQALRELEMNNRVIPVVGDFAGDKAIRAVARYLTARGLTIGAFYTSNVEYYLYQNGRRDAFMSNVQALPLDRGSTFIRYLIRNVRMDPGALAQNRTVLDPIQDLLAAVGEHRIGSYADLLARSKEPVPLPE